MKSKLYFKLYNYDHDFSDEPKLYIDWYKHHKDCKWKGFTVRFGILDWMLDITWVNDKVKYAVGTLRVVRKKPDA